MARTTRTGKVLLAAVSMAAALAATAGPALAQTNAQSAVGDFTSGPFHVQFSAQRAANSPATAATGTFTATGALGMFQLTQVNGPVTCLDVEGNRVGLFYPITNGTPSLLGRINSGVFLYAGLGPDGKPNNVTFLPVPYNHVTSCWPLGGPRLPVSSGTLLLTS